MLVMVLSDMLLIVLKLCRSAVQDRGSDLQLLLELVLTLAAGRDVEESVR
jgi:hypothetical protein